MTPSSVLRMFCATHILCVAGPPDTRVISSVSLFVTMHRFPSAGSPTFICILSRHERTSLLAKVREKQCSNSCVGVGLLLFFLSYHCVADRLHIARADRRTLGIRESSGKQEVIAGRAETTRDTDVRRRVRNPDTKSHV